MSWHSRYSPFEHRTHFVLTDVADPNRDTQWMRNKSAVLAFIGGCEIEFQSVDGKWHPLRLRNFQGQNMNDATSVFRNHPCRVVGEE